MRTLRELGEFVGLPQDSAEFGAPTPPIALRLVAKLLAPASTADQRRSMRALIGLVRTLPAISLDAQLLNPTPSRDPYVPVVRVNSTPGLVISTRIHYLDSGRELGSSRNYGAAGGDYSFETLGPGQWEIAVRRAGIANSGYVKLSRSFRVSVARDEPLPPPPPPDPPTRPNISVEPSGPVHAIKFVVTGTGFLPNQSPHPDGVTVRAADGMNPQSWRTVSTGSDADGRIRLELDPIDATDLTPNALGVRILSISAADKRKDPNSVPANEPLWSNIVSFSF